MSSGDVCCVSHAQLVLSVGSFCRHLVLVCSEYLRLLTASCFCLGTVWPPEINWMQSYIAQHTSHVFLRLFCFQ